MGVKRRVHFSARSGSLSEPMGQAVSPATVTATADHAACAGGVIGPWTRVRPVRTMKALPRSIQRGRELPVLFHCEGL